MRQGIPLAAHMLRVGPLANPPTPTAAMGRNSLMIRLAIRSLFHILNSTTTFFSRCFLSKPQIGSPLISYPAAGTRCISILPKAPTKSILASGRFALMALAIEIAGKMWPPVPPPLMMILSSLSMTYISYRASLLLCFLVWSAFSRFSEKWRTAHQMQK